MTFGRKLRRQIERIKKEAAKRRNKVLFEPLEPRILLSSDPLSYTAAAGTAANLTLRFQNVEGTDILQLFDETNQTVVQSQALAEISAVEITGSDLDDTFKVDLDFDAFSDSFVLTFDGGSGNDMLLGPNSDSIWEINGPDTGTLNDQLFFNSIENLTGAEGNEDTFVFTPSGSQSGVIEGGAGGFDTLVIDGSGYPKSVFTATGPDSGMVDLDGKLISYSGLEPITLSGVDDVTIDLSELDDPGAAPPSWSDDVVTLKAGTPGNLTFQGQGTFETINLENFDNPSSSLTIYLGGGDDQLTIESLDMSADLTVHGDDGDDTFLITGNLHLNGGDLAVNAETITVQSGAVVSTRTIADNVTGDHETDPSVGDSGNISFTGEIINVGVGAKILTHDDRGIAETIDNQTSPTTKWITQRTMSNVGQASTSGSGTDMTVKIAIDENGEPTVTLSNPGTGYADGDTVTFNPTDGYGSAITVQVNGVTGGVPDDIDNQTSPTTKWIAPRTMSNVGQASTSGSGTDMTVKIAIDENGEPTVTLSNPGTGYAHGDTVTFSPLDGYGDPITVEVTGAKGGDIRLQATSTVGLTLNTPVDPLLFETDNAEARIELLGATLKGRMVEVTASSDTSKTTTENDDPVTKALTDAGLLDFSEIFGWSFSNATTEVRVGAGTAIQADTDVIISATATSESIIKTLGVGLGFTYAESEAISKAYVEQGATVTAGSTFSLQSVTNNTVEAITYGASQGASINFAMTDATSNADAYIENGATISATSLDVTAEITNEIETTAEPFEITEGDSKGFAIAVSQLTSNANAYVNSEMTIPGAISIAATTTTDNRTSASAEPKSSFSGIAEISEEAPKIWNAIKNYFSDEDKKPKEEAEPSGEKPKKFDLSAAVLIAEASNTTNAYVGPDAELRSGDSISVASEIEDDFRILAVSESEEANVSVSGAVAVGSTTNTANAYIDDGAEVSAANLIEVKASTTIENPADFSSAIPSDFWEGFQALSNVEGFLQEGVTSYLRSSAGADDDTSKLTIAGSVNILTFNNTANAYIGAGAQINPDTTTYVPSDDQTVTVKATNTLETVNLVGVLGFISLTDGWIDDGGGFNTDKLSEFYGTGGKASLGGSYNQISYNTTTQAVIKDGADVYAKKDVIVEAKSNQYDFLMAVAGGEAEKFGISGAVSYAKQNSLTLAQIQSGAVITGGALSVTARDDTKHINVTGGVVVSENVGVGASVGINDIDRQTYAVIGGLPDAQGGPWEITFNSTGDVDQITAEREEVFNGTPSSETLEEGALDTWEVQEISQDGATQGQVKLIYGPDETNPLDFNASAAQVESALNELPSIVDAGGVSVKGEEGGPWQITFNEPGDREQVTAEAVAGSNYDGSLTWSTVLQGALDKLEEQRIEDGGASQGSFTLTYIGQKTAPIANDAPAADMESALNDLETISNAGGVTVSGGDGSPWQITFSEPGDREQITAEGVEFFDGTLDPSTITGGDGTTQEVQRIDHTGTEGAFRLSFGGQTTRPIAHDASVAEVESALNEIVSGGVKVTAAPGGDPSLDTVNVSDDVLLDATSDGNFYVFSLAASVRTKGDDGSKPADPQNGVEPEDPLDGETLPALFGDAEGAPTEDDQGNPGEPSEGQGKTGIGIAGDVSINTITDSAMAYISDRGKFSANSIILSSLNQTDLIAAAGAAAMSTGGSDKTSLGIAGSFSKNVLAGKTKSYVIGATITETHGLTLTAQRTGDIFSLTAGGALVPDKKGIAIAGSVSLNKIENETETFLDRVQATVTSSAQLSGDIFLSSVDTSEMLVIAGSLSYGGKAGIGASVALNKNYNTTKATIMGSTLAHGGELTLWAINDNEITSAAAGIAASKDTLGASGAVGLNFIDNEVEASISGSTNRGNDNGWISLLAKDDSLIESLAGAVGASKKIGFGGALAYNSIENTITAFIDDSQLETTDSLSVQALSLGKIKTISAGAAGAQKLSLAGAVSLNFIENTIDAHISNSPDIGAVGTISVLAADSATIRALSGSVAGAGKVAIGASVGYNDIGNTTSAYIVSSNVNSSGGNVVVGASESADVTSIAAGGAGAGKVAIGGSVTINDMGNTTKAYISGNSTVIADGSVVVSAHDELSMLLVAGVLGGAGTAAIGVSNTTVITNNLVESYIGNAQVTARGNQAPISVAAADKDINGNRTTESFTGLAVTATSWEDIQSFAVAGQGAGKAAIAGSATVNVLTETTTAYIGSGATINGDNGDAGETQGVNVTAYDDTEILSVAGALSGAGTAAIGAGADVGVIDKQTQAYIWADAVNASGDVKVQANSTEDILSISASLGGAGTVAIAGSAGVYVMDIKTRAFIGDDPSDGVDLTGTTTTVAADGSVLVSAFDDSEIDIIAGNIAGAGTAGVGVAAAVTVIDKTTEAFLGPNADVTGMGGGEGVTAYTGEFTTDFVPDSGSDDFAAVPAAQISQVDPDKETITFTAPHDFTTGQAVIYSKGSSDINIEGDGTLEDGETYYVIAADTDGSLGPTEIKLAASEQDAYDGNAINLADSSISGTHSLSDGIPSAPNGDVQAPGQQLAGGTDTDFDDDGYNDLNPDSDTQTKQRTSVPGMRTVNGVAVSAVNKDDIETIGVSGGGAGTVAVNIGGSVNVISNNTFAYVADGAKVNKDTDITDGEQLDQSVLVAAGNDLYHMGIAGAISISGTVSVTPGADVTVITNQTKAFIDDGAEVRADKNIEVVANAREDILSIAAGVGGSGTVGIGVSASVYVMDNTTYAYIGNDAGSLADGAIAKAEGNILVSASDTTEIFTVAGSLGIGFGAAGIGGAAGINIIDKDTQAFVGNFATVDAKGKGGYLTGVFDGSNTSSEFGTEDEFRGLAVQAQSREDLFVIGASAGGGLYAGLAGGVTVNVINSDTFAYIGTDAEINQDQENLNADQNQSVNVSAANEVSSFTLGGGLAIGAVGIAGGVDVGIIRNDTQAYIGSDAKVDAVRDVDVNALSRKDIESYAMSVGAGLGAIAGSVSVWSIGSEFGDATYSYTEVDTSDESKSTSSPETAVSEDDITSTLSPEGDSSEGDPVQGFVDNLGNYDSTDQNGPDDDTPDNTQELGKAINRAGSGISGKSDNLLTGAMAEPANEPLLGGTSAYVGSGATVTAGGDVNIRAKDRLDQQVVVGSASLGGIGIGAAVAVINVESKVNAFIAPEATVKAGIGENGDVLVHASFVEDFYGLSISGQMSGALSLGAQVVVFNDTSTQTAYIGGPVADEAHSATVDQAGGSVIVEAKADRTIEVLTAGGQLSLGAGIGASVALINAHGSTTAVIDDARIGQGGTVGNVRITAESVADVSAETWSVTGGLGIGLGASVALATYDPTIEASIRNDAEITVTHDVIVESHSRADVDTEAFGITLGGVAALGASVSIATNNPTIDTYIGNATVTATGGSVILRSLNNYDSTGMIRLDQGSDAYALAGSGSLFLGAAGAYSEAETSATMDTHIADGATIEAGTDVSLLSLNNNDAEATSTGVAGGLVGVGVSLGYATTSGSTRTYIGSADVTAGKDVAVRAYDYGDATVDTFAAAGGIVGGAGNDANAKVNPTVKAEIWSGASITAGDDIVVDALTVVSARTSTEGISAGGLAVGASYADSQVNSTVTAYVGGTITAGSLTVTARNLVPWPSGYTAEAETTGSAGALVGVDATNSDAKTVSSVKSYVADGSKLTITGATTIGATNNTKQKADANSNVGGLIAAGISDADASSVTVTEAYLGTNIRLTGGSLTVTATGTDDNFAETTAGSFGLAGVASASAETTTTSSTTAEVNDGSFIDVAANDVLPFVDSDTDSTYTTDDGTQTVTTGQTVDVLRGHTGTGDVGTRYEYIGKYAHYTTNEGTQEVHPSETVDVVDGFQGTGEVGNRYRYVGNTPSTVDLKSEDFSNENWEDLGASRDPNETIDLTSEDFSNAYNWREVGVVPGTGVFTITAEHTAKPNSKVRSLAGGLFGGAGAETDNTITSAVQANVGDNVSVQARDLTIEAINHLNKSMLSGGNIKGEAGGLIAGGGADSDTIISLMTLVSIGDNTSLEVVGSPAAPGNFTLRTLNDIVAKEKVVLSAGGGLSGLFGNASIMAETDLARVEIGSADLRSVGEVNISARGQGEVVTLVEAEAYGLGTLITGMAESIIRPTNEIAIGTGAHIVARGDLNLSAGTSTDFARDKYSIEVRHDSFAGSAIPLDDVDAQAILIQHNTIDIDSGAVLETARSANLHTERLGLADMLAKAKAVNWVSSLTDALNGAAAEYQYKGTSHAEAHGLVQMDGTVRTGIERDRSLTLDDWDPLTGTITAWGTVNPTDVGIDFWVTREKLESDLAQDLADARSNLALYEKTNLTLKEYYQSEITRLEGLLAAEGLLTYSNITIPDHGYNSGDAVVYHNTGSGGDIGGLVDGQTYYVIAKDDKPDTLALAATYEDAVAASPKGITMKPVGASNSHSLSKDGTVKIFTLEDLGGSSRVEQYVMTVHVAPVWAEAGSIDVRGDVLQGEGIFEAPGDPSVTILNHTPAFLVVHGITIPENNGGLFFTGDPILEGEDVIERNEFNIGLDALTPPFGEICGHWNNYDPNEVAFSELPPDPSVSEPPNITVINDFEAGTLDHNNDGQQETYPWPDITVVGDIDNLGGDVSLATPEQGEGDVLLHARVRAQNLTIVAGGALYVDGVTDFAVGGEPYKKYDVATTGAITSTYDHDNNPATPDITVTSYYPGIEAAIQAEAIAIANQGFAEEATVYADKIFIDAEYLNINGLIQSGKGDYNLVLGSEIASQIADIEQAQMTGLVTLSLGDNSDFFVRYDTVSDQIVVDEMRVSGGKIEMTGHILNTGTGEIRVLGGYGNINITNNTSYDLVLNRLDASQRGAGELVIIDKAKGGSENPTATMYRSSGSGLTRTVDDGTGPVVEQLTGNTDTYEPEEGWRYGWSVGVETFERSWAHYRSSAWLDIDALAKDPDNIHWDTTEVAEQPKLMDEGPYYFRPEDADPDTPGYQDPIPDVYTHDEITDDLTDLTVFHVNHWSTSTWYGKTTYHDIFVGEKYQRTIDTHTVEADRPFTVRFVGSEEGQVTVTSNANVVLKGPIVNPSGTTTIASSGSIEQVGEAPYVSGKRINLSAATGIGGNTPLQTSVSDEPVYQYTTESLNYSGDLPVVDLETFTPSTVFSIASGDRVKLAQDYSHGGVPGAVYQYKGLPDKLDLALQDYNNTSTWELVDHWPSLIATTSDGDIHLTEIIGDLHIDKVVASSGGDVTLSSQGGMDVGRDSTGTLCDVLIEGGAITLSAGGDVGSSSQPLVLESGDQLKDLVTVSADGGVYFKEKTGDLRLEQVTAAGAVEIEVMSGSILDANQEENRDERSVEKLRDGVWGDLQLTVSTGANEKIDGLIDSYAAKKEQEYQTYWKYRNTQPHDPLEEVRVEPLQTGKQYFVIRVDEDTIRLAASARDAADGEAIDIDGTNATGRGHGISVGSVSFDAQDDVDSADDVITIVGHGFNDGDAVAYSAEGDTENIGLTEGVTYYVEVVDDHHIKLMSDEALTSKVEIAPIAEAATHRLYKLGLFDSSQVSNEDDTITLVGHGLETGDAVFYSLGQTDDPIEKIEIVNLQDGGTYYVIFVDDDTVKLSSTPGGTELNLDNSEATGAQHQLFSGEPDAGLFDPAADVNNADNTITIAAHGLSDGQEVTYRSLIYDPNFEVTLSETEEDAYRNQLGYGDDEIAALEASRTEQYHTLHGQYGGYGDVYDPNFDYTPTAAEEDAIRDSVKVWTEEELLYAVGAGLLKPVSDTTISFEAPNVVGTSVTLTTHSGGVGDAVGYQAIDLTPPINLSEDQRIALAAAERDDLVYLGPSVSVAVSFSAAGNSITRTDGGSWLDDGFKPRMRMEVVGSVYNNTEGGLLYEIQNVGDSELTLTSDADLADETGVIVTITPEALTPTVFTTVDFADSGSADTITRTDGKSWLTDGFSDGMRIRVMGVTDNANAEGTFYTIASATDDTLTLTSDAILTDETDKDVSVAPEITKIIIIEREDVDVSASEDIVIDADTSVYLGSGYYQNVAYDLNLNSVKAGTTIHIKGDKAIYNWTGTSATNIEGGDLILEAAGGPIGASDNKLYTNLAPTATITARAQDDIYIVEREGNVNMETMFSEMGSIYLEAQGSIIDALDHDFTKIAANHVELAAATGTIGEEGDYLEVDLAASGTLIAYAEGSIWIRETLGDMNVEHVESYGGNIDLRAHLFILDALDSPLPEIIGNNITLIADIGGLGLSENHLDIDSAHSGSGVLTSSSDLANTYIIETDGDAATLDDLSINEVSAGEGYTAFITAPEGSILNGRADDGPNVVSGKTYLVARDDIGEESKQLRSEVGNIEGESIVGSTWVENTGPLTVGGVVDSSDPGMLGGGSARITATSPITVTEDMIYPHEVILTAGDSPDAGDDLVVLSGVTVQSENSYVELRAGDMLLLEPGSIINASGPVTLICDFESGDPEGGMINPQGQIIATSLEIRGQEHDDVFALGNLSRSANVLGGEGIDTLIGPDEPDGPEEFNSWEILGPNTGNLNEKFFFDSVESLTGGSGNDTFYFRGPGSVDGIVDGGDGFDILDFLQSDFIQEAAQDFLDVDLPIGDWVVDFTATGGITRIEDIKVILLAEVQEDGTLVLNMGPRAAERLTINTEDGDEEFLLYHVDGDPAGAEGETIAVLAFGFTLEYDGVSSIRGSGGLGDDTIILSSDIMSPAELDGGPGSDTLTGGAGNDILLGDSGIITRSYNDDDTLHKDVLLADVGMITGAYTPSDLGWKDLSAAAVSDLLEADLLLLTGGYNGDGSKHFVENEWGCQEWETQLLLISLFEDGNDMLEGGGGDDSLFGGRGDDELTGGNGSDYLVGNGGNDFLEGGDDNDVLVGDEVTRVVSDSTLPNVLRGLQLMDGSGQAEAIVLGDSGTTIVPIVSALPGKDLDPLVGVITQVTNDLPILPDDNVLHHGDGTYLVPFASIVTDVANHLDLLAGNDMLFGGGGDDTLVGDNATVFSPSVTINESFLESAFPLTWDIYGAFDDFGDLIHRLHHTVGDADNCHPSYRYQDVVVDQTFWLGNDVMEGGEGNDFMVGDDMTVMAPSFAVPTDLVDGLYHLIQDLKEVGDEADWALQEFDHVAHDLRDEVIPVKHGRRVKYHLVHHIDRIFVGKDSLVGGEADDLMVGDNWSYLAPEITVTSGDWPSSHGFWDHDHGWGHGNHYGWYDWHHHKDPGYESADVWIVGNDTMDGGAGDDLMFGDSVVLKEPTMTSAPDVSWWKFRAVHHKVEHILEDIVTHDYTVSGGNDVMVGGDGDDVLFGQDGEDKIYGGAGRDLLVGGHGKDTLVGGPDKDKLIHGVSSYLDSKGHKEKGCYETKVEPCASWVKHFVSHLATDDTHNPNSDIKVVLPGGDDCKADSTRGVSSGPVDRPSTNGKSKGKNK
jgi:hypothetical protein